MVRRYSEIWECVRFRFIYKCVARNFDLKDSIWQNVSYMLEFCSFRCFKFVL